MPSVSAASLSLSRTTRGASCRNHRKADSHGIARPALFAAQRTATPDAVTAPQTVEVDQAALKSAAQKLLPELGVPEDILPADEIECVHEADCEYIPKERTDPITLTRSRIAALQSAEFAPSCAIVGGILGQDILNAVGGKEEPVRNLLVFEGATGQGRVYALGV